MEFINEHRKKFFIFFAILFIITIGLTGTRKYNPELFKSVMGFLIVPVQNVMYDAVENISSIFSKKQDIAELKAQNDELRKQLAALTDENKRLSLFEAENIELTKLLNINRKYPDYEKMGVQVISTDISNWYNVFTIDRGAADGIREDMFVVADGGLVGRVFEVSEKYSKVMAIIDDRSAVHGQSRQTEDVGVVKGDTYLMQKGQCSMEYIDLDAEMNVGDEIITSVFSEVYPAGISIGYVNEIFPSADGLTKTAIITPGVDFVGLTKAMVLIRKID